MADESHRNNAPLWMTLVAFAIIYFVWGSTFLAIRVGVQQMPPLAMAAARFLAAGIVLVGWMYARREALPTRRQWSSISILAALIFVIDYGCLFWAEQRVPSGPAAVMMATIPGFTALAEILLLRTQRLTLRLSLALLAGLLGVVVLTSRSLGTLHGQPLDHAGAVALIVGAISWSLASVLSRKLPLPESKGMSSGAQMLVGGGLLVVLATVRGDFARFDVHAVTAAGWVALLYLIVAGSLIGFTAYVWLIHHQSPTKVGTYAYVNPVVAVLLGYLFAHEPLDSRTVFGAVLVLAGVLLITTARADNRA